MGHNNGTVVAPVSFADVNYVLSSSHTDLGNLCKDANINKWSKYKPINKNKIGVLSTGADWINGGARYGLKPPTSGDKYPFDSNGDYVEDEWVYDRPTGGASSPYRLSDFKDYYHIAPCPLDIAFQDGNLVISQTKSERDNAYVSFTMTFENSINGYIADKCMSLDDVLGGNSNWYMCVVLWRKITNKILQYYAYSSQKIGEVTSGTNYLQILVNIGTFYNAIIAQGGSFADNQKWNSRVFLSASNTSSSSLTQGKLIELKPNFDFKEWTVKNPVSFVSLGQISFTTTIAGSGNSYNLSVFSITINKGNYTGTSVSYTIYGSGSGRMNQGSTYTTDEVVLKTGTFSLTGQTTTISNVSVGATWNYEYSQLPSQAHKVAVARIRLTISNVNHKDVSVITDITTGPMTNTTTVP